jgi:hypothetical protein
MTEELSFKDKIKTLQFSSGKHRVKTKEIRSDEGYRVKITKDDATTRGNLTIEHAKNDRVDVNIRPDMVTWPNG